MRIGMVGLGRMGAGMVRRLLKGGHECVAYDNSADAVKALFENAIAAVPECQRKAEPALIVGPAGDSIFAPTVGA